MSLLNNKRKRRCIPSEWEELPEEIIEHIYANLNRSDRLNMSLVCKSWSQGYGSPSLWKTFTFNFKKSYLDLDVWPEVKFAQKFGCMFRDVAITIPKGISRKSFKRGIKEIQSFFEALIISKGQLLSIKYADFNFSNRFWYQDENATLFQSITNFMGSQNNLQTADFFYSKCKEEDGVNLLLLICENNAHTLRTLILKQFIRKRFESEEGSNDLVLQYRTLMQSFMNLEILKIDYSQFFENIINSFSNEGAMQNNLINKLSLIELELYSEILPLKGIMPISWQNLRKLCPGLKVNFQILYKHEMMNPFTFYMPKYIPLVLLDFYGLRDGGLVISDLLIHLKNCLATQYLEHLKITWIPVVDDISTDFIPFLQDCQKLKTLEIVFKFPCAGLKELFESLLRSCPVSLESVHLSIKYVMDEGDRFFLKLLADEYHFLLQAVGLKLTVLINS